MYLSAGEIAKAVRGRIIAGSPGDKATGIATDSSKVSKGSLFVPVIGKRVDGHRFMTDAFRSGASICFSSEGLPGSGASGTVIEVSDTVEALQDLGAYYRDRYVRCPFIGVTGSVGKTTTREMIALALSARFRTYATPGNANSQVGVPITVCDTPDDAGIGVIELGVSEIGEMERIARVAKVESAVVTRIGESHIAQFGAKEITMREKLHIADFISNGVLLLNHDDELLRVCRVNVPVRTFGLAPGAYYSAENILRSDNGSGYDFVADGVCLAHVMLRVPGDHMISNSLAAMAFSSIYGVDPADAARRLSEFSGVRGRLAIAERGGIKIINDAYNASPESMREGLKVLNSMKGARRIAVLADMLELGERENDYHSELGRFIGEELPHIDILYLVGPLMEYTYEALSGKAFSACMDIRKYSDAGGLKAELSNELRDGDTVFFKGSNMMGLSAIAEEICSTL